MRPDRCHGRTPRIVATLLAVALVALAERSTAAEVLVASDAGILHFNARTGEYLGVLVPIGSGGLTHPAGMAVGPGGQLYVGNPGTESILRFNSSTGDFVDEFAKLTVPPGPLYNHALPRDLCVGVDGDLFVVQRGRDDSGITYPDFVARYSGEDGVAKAYLGAPQTYFDMACGPDDRLYFSSFDGVIRFEADTGDPLGPFTHDLEPFWTHAGLAFGPDDDLFVSSYDQHAVRRFDGETGEFIDTFVRTDFGTDLSRFDFGPDGSLYGLRDNFNDQVVHYGPDGQLLSEFEIPDIPIMASDMAYVPEPAALTLCAVGATVAAIAASRRRRRSVLGVVDPATAADRRRS